METRTAHAVLHSILRKCFGMTPLEKFELEQLDKHLLGNKQRVAVRTHLIDGSGKTKNAEGGEVAEDPEDTSIGSGSFMRGSKSRLSQG